MTDSKGVADLYLYRRGQVTGLGHGILMYARNGPPASPIRCGKNNNFQSCTIFLW